MVVTRKDRMVVIFKVWEILERLHHSRFGGSCEELGFLVTLPHEVSRSTLPIPRITLVELVRFSLPLVHIQVLGYLGRAYTL